LFKQYYSTRNCIICDILADDVSLDDVSSTTIPPMTHLQTLPMATK